MFGIDHGQPGDIPQPVRLGIGTGVGSTAYAAWAERSRLTTTAAQRSRQLAALRRGRRQAERLRRRADRAEARLRRLEAVAGLR